MQYGVQNVSNQRNIKSLRQKIRTKKMTHHQQSRLCEKFSVLTFKTDPTG